MHIKARTSIYPVRMNEDTVVTRTSVPEDKVNWSEVWEDYKPVEFTAPFVLTATWADPPLGTPGFDPKWNSVDGKVNRKSFNGEYSVVDGAPRNPEGRTGIQGRGVLGRWGPNHAADPIVTRWRRNKEGVVEINQSTGRKILEFVSIERKDGGGWAIPGGMVDPGETVSATLKREFMEEAMDSTTKNEEENAKNAKMLDEYFLNGEEIYKGYVDDPRNTDNAWMETVAVNFHDDTGEKVGRWQLKAGDDAKSLEWKPISGMITLYASHKDFIQKTAEKLEAHW
ncbi:ADP-ribose pyrophosphatase, mitochondrial isoform X2 [Eurytemora carolleeae]|nr:ADP-ribose pyrophosphatase, mitochondrial isoform X2 [Eurytemora carolleeae]XP_023328433.1 ADP-ribose pyrophosphatase, mitochondrial isoform X2 [Eurytemora carolleeae]|eukprot:XP_023328432.1 ADP-ribose pyrophosphatase, mitochondrial-like isoform X2 [Eurytemora affinis]